MQRKIVGVGFALVLVGAIVFLIGAVIENIAYGSLIKAAEEIYDTSTLVRGYEESQAAEFTKSLGMFLALAGIAMGFFGIIQEPTPLSATGVSTRYQESKAVLEKSANLCSYCDVQLLWIPDAGTYICPNCKRTIHQMS